MTRKQQALVALACLVGGCLSTAVGAWAYERGMAWLDKGAAYPGGFLYGVALVFFLRAVLVGRPRRWMFRYDRDADRYGRHHRSD